MRHYPLLEPDIIFIIRVSSMLGIKPFWNFKSRQNRKDSEAKKKQFKHLSVNSFMSSEKLKYLQLFIFTAYASKRKKNSVFKACMLLVCFGTASRIRIWLKIVSWTTFRSTFVQNRTRRIGNFKLWLVSLRDAVQFFGGKHFKRGLLCLIAKIVVRWQTRCATLIKFSRQKS